MSTLYRVLRQKNHPEQLPLSRAAGLPATAANTLGRKTGERFFFYSFILV
jgi:hypothetical protein